MKEKKPFKFSIRAKTIILSLVLAIFVTEIAVAYYAIVISNRNKERFDNIANGLSTAIAETINVDDFKTVKNKVKPLVDNWKENHQIVFSTDTEDDANKAEQYNQYMAAFEPLNSDAEFQTAFNNLCTFLRGFSSSEKNQINKDENHVKCAYIGYIDYYLDNNNQKVGYAVYLVDGDEKDACPPGWIDPIYETNKEVLDNPEKGLPAYQTNTDDYGYLLTSGKAIKDTIEDENGKKPVLGYAYVDISLDAVKTRQANGIIRLTVYMVITVAILTVIVVFVVHFMFTKPVRKLAAVASSFDSQDPEKSHQAFTNLNVNTRDELNELATALKGMENTVRERIFQLTDTNEALKISQLQTQKMTALANRDSLTGVQSKTAYDTEASFVNDKIANKEEISFGLAMIDLNYLKATNDKFGHDVGDEALIKLANIICLVFKHSPVYRVGGDEFVVILRNEDLLNHDHLIEEFIIRMKHASNNKHLQIEERISAAIGYSEFDKEQDKSVDDVFKRADKAMYKHKKEMKETM
ncbi:MAG: diguanylate cyclase [Bacilli bacterium]|nr:diguanylate cyclase [Bacilli bacterium]